MPTKVTRRWYEVTIKTYEGKRDSVSCYGKGLTRPLGPASNSTSLHDGKCVYGHVWVCIVWPKPSHGKMCDGSWHTNEKLKTANGSMTSNAVWTQRFRRFGCVTPGTLIKLDVFKERFQIALLPIFQKYVLENQAPPHKLKIVRVTCLSAERVYVINSMYINSGKSNIYGDITYLGCPFVEGERVSMGSYGRMKQVLWKLYVQSLKLTFKSFGGSCRKSFPILQGDFWNTSQFYLLTTGLQRPNEPSATLKLLLRFIPTTYFNLR